MSIHVDVYWFRMAKKPAMFQMFVVVLACSTLFGGVSSQGLQAYDHNPTLVRNLLEIMSVSLL